MKHKVLISDPLEKEGVDILRSEKDFEVKEVSKLTEEELIKIIPEFDGLIVRSGTTVTRAIIDAGSSLKVIARAGVGIDNVDVKAATEKGILVMNSPEGNTISTAELAFALIMASARKIPFAHQSMAGGKFDRKSFQGNQIFGKTLGIIGLGRIGREIAQRANVFGMTILGYDPYLSNEQAQILNIALKSLEEIYKESDFITVHTPLTDKTKNMISKKEIEMMKPSVYLINCARGGIMNEQDVADALKNGRIKGAAFDVYSTEPPDASNPLLSSPNCILTPHLGASTKEAQLNVALETATAVKHFFVDKVAVNAVNYPQVPQDLVDELQPFISLCERIGSILSCMNHGDIKQVELNYQGNILAKGINICKMAFLKGLLEQILAESTNFINAPIIAQERGIKVVEANKNVMKEYYEVIQATVRSSEETHRVSGTVHSNNQQRILEIDGFEFDLEPVGNYLIIKNVDKPGVVGTMGTILGKNSINIANMQLGRKKKGEDALTMISVDEKVSDSHIHELKKGTSIVDVFQVDFR